jgi:hypothetical protein
VPLRFSADVDRCGRVALSNAAHRNNAVAASVLNPGRANLRLEFLVEADSDFTQELAAAIQSDTVLRKLRIRPLEVASNLIRRNSKIRCGLAVRLRNRDQPEGAANRGKVIALTQAAASSVRFPLMLDKGWTRHNRQHLFLQLGRYGGPRGTSAGMRRPIVVRPQAMCDECEFASDAALILIAVACCGSEQYSGDQERLST